MSTVTGTFLVTLDGVTASHTISSMPKAEFWLKQRAVLRVLEMTSDWGLEELLGVTPVDAGPATGDVSYEYSVDFSGGGSSEGGNTWHSVPQGAAIEIAKALTAAFA